MCLEVGLHVRRPDPIVGPVKDGELGDDVVAGVVVVAVGRHLFRKVAWVVEFEKTASTPSAVFLKHLEGKKEMKGTSLSPLVTVTSPFCLSPCYRESRSRDNLLALCPKRTTRCQVSSMPELIAETKALLPIQEDVQDVSGILTGVYNGI